MTEEEARTYAEDQDKSFGVLAEENGILDEYKAGLIAEMTERIQQAVSDGKIDEEQAAEKIERIEEHITSAEAEDLKAKGRHGGKRTGNKGKNLETILEEEFDGDFDALKASMMDRFTDRLSKAVEEGKLEQEDADLKLEEMETFLDSATSITDLQNKNALRSGHRPNPDRSSELGRRGCKPTDK